MIHLFYEGNFYRAYEWSAWLCHRYMKEFKPTHRILKNIEDSVVFVGFPVTSLEKYVPSGATLATNDDKSVDVVLPVEMLPVNSDAEVLSFDFVNWKSSVPLTEASKRRVEEEKNGVQQHSPMRLTDVMHWILAYPIEQRSPMECMAFLAEIKQQVAEIF